MKNKKILLSIAGVISVSLMAAIVFTNQDTQSYISHADEPYIEKTLNSNELQQCTFEPYTFDKKSNSRKFKYEMAGGKFIEGAILFGDCNYQFVGNNLSEPFGIDNTSAGNQNSDFHIFFNAHGIKRAYFYYTAQLNQAYNIGIPLNERVKLTDKCRSGLYEELNNQTYSNITKNVGETDFYIDKNEGGFELKTTQLYTGDIYRPNQSDKTANAVAFQLNAFTIPKTYKITFTLTKVILRYTC